VTLGLWNPDDEGCFSHVQVSFRTSAAVQQHLPSIRHPSLDEALDRPRTS
jgi:hypothetical protein